METDEFFPSGEPANEAEEDDMDAFLVVVEEIYSTMDEVEENVEKMKKMQRLIITEPSRAEKDK